MRRPFFFFLAGAVGCSRLCALFLSLSLPLWEWEGWVSVAQWCEGLGPALAEGMRSAESRRRALFEPGLRVVYWPGELRRRADVKPSAVNPKH